MSTTVVDDYLAAWNETDPAARAATVARVFSAAATYTDPLTAVRGHDGIVGAIAATQAQLPGMRFRSLGPAQAHHDLVRFAWELGPADVPAPVAGSDVVELDQDGRIRTVLGFLDRVPEA